MNPEPRQRDDYSPRQVGAARRVLVDLGQVLAAKIALSAVAFGLGLRRNTLTAGAMGWMVGGWLIGGLFIAGYAGLVCQALGKPGVWIWAALAGFLALLLADLALAPLAMTWNRHR